MTWLEILWQSFWCSLAWRQHERPYAAEAIVPQLETPGGAEAAWKETTAMASPHRLRIAAGFTLRYDIGHSTK